MTELARVFSDHGWQTLPGSPVYHGPFVFAFDTPGLADGVPFYVPAVGDLLLDVAVVVDEAWDGTSPTCDIGTAVGASLGLAGVSGNGPFRLSNPDTEEGGEGVQINLFVYAYALSSVSGYSEQRIVPSPFTAVHPLKVWVTQDGLAGGADPGATQGRARLYWATVTPRAV